MIGKRPATKYILFSALFTAAGVLAMLLPTVLWLRITLAAVYFCGGGYLVGRLALTREALAWKILLGLLLQTASLMVLGSVVYFFHRLDLWPTLAVMVAAPTAIQLTALLGLKLAKDQPVNLHQDNPQPAMERRQIATLLIGLLVAVGFSALAIYGLQLLSGAATELSIRSPWDDVPRLFFIILFVLAVAAFGLALGRISGTAALAPLVGLSLLATTVAVMVYSVGFGFDSFIHQATESHIFNFGEMTPKPPYYLGQYALVTILARLVGGFVTTIDTWLVPLAFTLVLPVAYWSLRKSFGWSSSVAAASCLPLLIMPLSSFVLTTPQGLANVLLLITTFVLLASATTTSVPKWIPALLALATVAVHPLAGVPLLLFVAMTAYLGASHSMRRMPEVRWTFFVKLFLLTCVALPIMFIVNSRLSGADVTLDQEALRTPAAIIEELKNPELQTRRFSAALDLVYFWRTSRTVTLAGLGTLGIVLLWLAGRRRKDERQREAAIAFAAGAFAFFVNYVLLRTWVRFPFLIEYERTNYADRMAELALFIVAPLALYAFGLLLQRLRKRGFPSLAVGLALLLAALITANVYLAYPRRDKYETSRGWSTSAADIKAVQSIDNDSASRDYVVLANQSVSAAAIRELGFKKYYDSADPEMPEPIFFYPIPTGGQLYQIFLDANDDYGTRDAALAALELTDAKAVYYVVNHYWWRAQQIIIQAKQESSEWWVIDDRVWVFKYMK